MDSDSIDFPSGQILYDQDISRNIFRSTKEDLMDIDRIYSHLSANEFQKDIPRICYVLCSNKEELDNLDKCRWPNLVYHQGMSKSFERRCKLILQHKYHMLKWLDSNILGICIGDKYCCKRKEHLLGKRISI